VRGIPSLFVLDAKTGSTLSTDKGVVVPRAPEICLQRWGVPVRKSPTPSSNSDLIAEAERLLNEDIGRIQADVQRLELGAFHPDRDSFFAQSGIHSDFSIQTYTPAGKCGNDLYFALGNRNNPSNMPIVKTTNGRVAGYYFAGGRYFDQAAIEEGRFVFTGQGGRKAIIDPSKPPQYTDVLAGPKALGGSAYNWMNL